MRLTFTKLFFIITSLICLIACTPKIQVVTPETPITVNLNVKIEHQINIQVDKQIETLLSQNSDIF